MPFVLADRVKETTTTTGTGAVTLLGASTGFQSFAAIGNANTTYYCIAGQTTSQWEIGIGTYTASGTTLSRDTVLANSAGTQPTALTLLSGTKDVFVTYPAGKSVNYDASNNVGIGTTSPNTTLEANKAITFSNVDTFGQFIVKAASGATGYLLNFGVDTTAGISFIQSVDRGTDIANLVLQRYGGNLLVGTTSAVEKLTIGSTSATSSGINLRTTATDFVIQPSNTAAGGVTIGVGFVAGGQGPMIFSVGGEKARINSSGQLETGIAGTAALPSFTRSGDLNTGIFFPAADTIAFSEGGTEAMRINASGQLETGIAGTAALPSFTRTGDLNTGIFFPAADTIAFSEGGTEAARFDASGNFQVQTGANVVWAPAPASISAAATLTNANIQGQIINTTGTTYTVTMPLGTTMETLVPWAAVNLGYDFTVINTASGTITMAVNTGVTSLGGLTIATGVSARFRIRRTAANTFILYRLG